jgi:hypothetical protein
MAKALFQILSLAKIRRHAESGRFDEGPCLLARKLVGVLDGTGEGDAEAIFCEVMNDYFFNMGPSEKRRHADSIALAFCAEKSDFDDLWSYLKAAGVTGRTYTRAKPSGDVP